KKLLALHRQARLARSAFGRSLHGVVPRETLGHAGVELSGDAPHEIVGIPFGAGVIAECFNLAHEIRRSLGSEIGKLGRNADATRPVAAGAKIDSLFFGRLLPGEWFSAGWRRCDA